MNLNYVEARNSLCVAGSRISGVRLAWTGALAALASAAAVAIVYAVASAADAIPQGVTVSGPGGEGPLTLGAAMTAATLAATGATLVFGLVCMFSHQPIRRFRMIALAVFLVSLGTPFSIQDAPGSMIATLLTMHLFVAAISVGLLTNVADRE